MNRTRLVLLSAACLVALAPGAVSSAEPFRLPYSWLSAAGVLAPNPLPLEFLDGVSGVCLEGAASTDVTGFAVGDTGDFNDDGYADFLIGAPGADSSRGIVYLVYGGLWLRGGGARLTLADINGVHGVRLRGIAGGDQAGASVSGAGDLNGDRISDLVLGAPLADPGGVQGAGESYIVYGRTRTLGTAGTFSLLTLNGSNGLRLQGNSLNGRVGQSAACVGDFNADGFDDVVVGASNVAGGAGEAYLVFGAEGRIGTGSMLALPSLDGTLGVRLRGAAGDNAGFAVAAAGDVNGDGYADIVIGAHSADRNGRTNSGSAYLIYGRAAAPGSGGLLELDSLSAADGVRIDGAVEGDRCGVSVAGAGDVNGDGYADVAIGCDLADPLGRTEAGAAYLLYGSASGIGSGAALDLAGLGAAAGVRILGAAAGDRTGARVGGGRDVDSDGYADVLVGAPSASPNSATEAGLAYALHGAAGGLGAGGTLDLASLSTTAGLALQGAAEGDQVGHGGALAADVDNDGYEEILLGGPTITVSGKASAGAAYVVFGDHLLPPLARTYIGYARAGDAPPTHIGAISTRDLPSSGLTLDYPSGDNGAGGASRVAVTLFRSPPPGTGPNVLGRFLNAYWRVHSDRIGHGTATVVAHFREPDLVGIDPSGQIRVYVAPASTGPWTEARRLSERDRRRVTFPLPEGMSYIALSARPLPTSVSDWQLYR